MAGTKENVRNVFSARAAEWAGWYATTERPGLETANLLSRQRMALEMITGAINPPARVLDVGCGTGDMAARLRERGYDVAGVDIAEPMIAAARRRWPDVRFEVGDGERLPFDDHTFDAVVSLGVIEYQDADEPTLREIRRVLEPGGIAVLSTPSAISPLYHLDRLALAGERFVKPLYYLSKYRLRGRAIPAEPPTRTVAIRRYRRGPWLRSLREAGFEPEDWVCRGWGWFRSRLGTPVSFLSRHGVGDGAAFARNPWLNWIGAEQLVRVRSTAIDGRAVR